MLFVTNHLVKLSDVYLNMRNWVARNILADQSTAAAIPSLGSIDQNDEGRNQYRPNEKGVEENSHRQRKSELAQ